MSELSQSAVSHMDEHTVSEVPHDGDYRLCYTLIKSRKLVPQWLPVFFC